MPHFWWRMVCSNVILDHLETSNAKMDLRNAFSSKFYVDPCLADIFFKVILRRKLKIEKRSDFFPKNVYFRVDLRSDNDILSELFGGFTIHV